MHTSIKVHAEERVVDLTELARLVIAVLGQGLARSAVGVIRRTS
jgi:hypothetical protein